jgi:hypothetical protein
MLCDFSWRKNAQSDWSRLDIYRRRQSSILDVRSSRGAGCDIDHYLVGAKLREGLSLSKWQAQEYDMQTFHTRKLNDTEQYQVSISSRLAALENCNGNVDINTARRQYKNFNQGESRSLRVKTAQQRFDEECSKLLDWRKQAKQHWLQKPSQMNGDLYTMWS